MNKRKILLGLMVIISLAIIMPLIPETVDAIDVPPRIRFLPVDDSETTLMDCDDFYIEDSENPNNNDSIEQDGNGYFDIEFGDYPWYENAMNVNLDFGKTNYYFADWDEFTITTYSHNQIYNVCGCYKLDSQTSVYIAGKCRWAGKHQNADDIDYRDESSMSNNGIPMSMNYPRLDEDLYGTITIKSPYDGHFDTKFMAVGYEYKWKIKWKISLLVVSDTEVDSDYYETYRERDYTDENNPPAPVHIDPNLKFVLTKTEAPPLGSQVAYTFKMEITHEVAFKTEYEFWSVPISYSDFSPDPLEKYVYLYLGD